MPRRMGGITGDKRMRVKGPLPPGARKRLGAIRKAKSLITGPQAKEAQMKLMLHTHTSKRRLGDDPVFVK